jgi:SAM-dependent methyltransferase
MTGAENPDSRSPSDPGDPRQMAKRASSFGSAAADYAQHRPGYPDAAIEWILEPVRDRRAVRVLDLAAGTGRLTEALQRAEVDVIAVEPDPEMRAEMLRRVSGVAVLAGTGEDIPLPDERVDAVLVGQALHWLDQDRALPEIARVLKPGGVFAALWNTDDHRVEWVAEYSRLSGFPPDEQGSSQPPIAEYDAFGPVEWEKFDNAHRRTVDSLVATVGTFSATLVLEPDERAAKLRRLREYLQSRPETSNGEFDLPLITHVARCVLRVSA